MDGHDDRGVSITSIDIPIKNLFFLVLKVFVCLIAVSFGYGMAVGFLRVFFGG